MKLTKSKLKQIIREEFSKVLKEHGEQRRKPDDYDEYGNPEYWDPEGKAEMEDDVSSDIAYDDLFKNAAFGAGFKDGQAGKPIRQYENPDYQADYNTGYDEAQDLVAGDYGEYEEEGY
tara:strand:+ start:507 stop:860 length:354 start_codon:yes stop_codon:yes gene_type:complete